MRPLMVSSRTSLFCLFGGRITSVGWETANSAAVSDQERDLAIVPAQHIKLRIPNSSQRLESSVLDVEKQSFLAACFSNSVSPNHMFGHLFFFSFPLPCCSIFCSHDRNLSRGQTLKTEAVLSIRTGINSTIDHTIHCQQLP